MSMVLADPDAPHINGEKKPSPSDAEIIAKLEARVAELEAQAEAAGADEEEESGPTRVYHHASFSFLAAELMRTHAVYSDPDFDDEEDGDIDLIVGMSYDLECAFASAIHARFGERSSPFAGEERQQLDDRVAIADYEGRVLIFYPKTGYLEDVDRTIVLDATKAVEHWLEERERKRSAESDS